MLRHSISRSSPDLVRIGFSTIDRSPSTRLAELLAACASADRRRQAGLDPVAPEQLALGPAQEVAALAIDQRDPPVEVEREQDDFGGVEVALRPVPLVAQGRLRLLALEDLVLELLGSLLRDGVEIAVLVDAADLPGQRHDQVLIVLGEGPALVADEADPAVDMGR